MIRTPEPFLTEKKKRKRTKPTYRFKENIRIINALRPYIYIPYANRTLTDRASSLESNRKHKLRTRKGATKKQRATHRTYKRDALRGYNKKQGNMKICTRCHLNKAVSDFDWQKDGRKQRRPYCFVCRKQMNAEAYQRKKHGT